MTVFKSFFKICKKNIGNLIMYTCIFLGIVITMIKVNTPKTVDSFKSTQEKVVIFNHSDSNLSNALIKYITDNHKIINGVKEDIDSFRDVIYNRDVDYILIIPEDFDTARTVNNYVLPGSIASIFLNNTIEAFISTYSSYEALGMSADEAYSKTLQTIELSTEVTIANETKTATYGEEHYYFQYIPYVFLCAICLSLAPVLISFNKTEVKKRMLCSDVTLLQRNMSLSFGSIFFGIAVVIIYLIVSLILFGSSGLQGTAGLLRIGNVFIFSFVSIAFAFLLSTLTTNPGIVNMYVNAYGLGSAFITGVFVPREFLASGVLSFGRFFPSYWYLNVEECACNVDNMVTSNIVTGYGIQILFALVFMVLALVIGSKKRAT